MKLTLDCPLTHQLSALQSNSALARLLSVAKITQSELPLEALVCQQYGLQLQPDYPIAAIAAVADGLNVGDAYWLRADPVHLILQRDCFSLAEPYPLLVEQAQALLLVQTLNQHFKQDGFEFLIGQSGAWYLRSEQLLDIQTFTPSVVAGKNVHQYLPQGAMAARMRTVLNEAQMLLHEHVVNNARESAGELAVNSVWLSDGGVMPSAITTGLPTIIAKSIFYKGLAVWSGAAMHLMPPTIHEFLSTIESNAEARLQLTDDEVLEGGWFSGLLTALRGRKINRLELNLGYGEKTVTAVITPLNLYLHTCQFWRKPKAVLDYI